MILLENAQKFRVFCPGNNCKYLLVYIDGSLRVGKLKKWKTNLAHYLLSTRSSWDIPWDCPLSNWSNTTYANV